MSEGGVPLVADVDLTDAARSKCGSWLACDGGLLADAYQPDTPQLNCGSGLAREGGLTGDAVIPRAYPFLR